MILLSAGFLAHATINREERGLVKLFVGFCFGLFWVTDLVLFRFNPAGIAGMLAVMRICKPTATCQKREGKVGPGTVRNPEQPICSFRGIPELKFYLSGRCFWGIPKAWPAQYETSSCSAIANQTKSFHACCRFSIGARNRPQHFDPCFCRINLAPRHSRQEPWRYRSHTHSSFIGSFRCTELARASRRSDRR